MKVKCKAIARVCAAVALAGAVVLGATPALAATTDPVEVTASKEGRATVRLEFVDESGAYTGYHAEYAADYGDDGVIDLTDNGRVDVASATGVYVSSASKDATADADFDKGAGTLTIKGADPSQGLIVAVQMPYGEAGSYGAVNDVAATEEGSETPSMFAALRSMFAAVTPRAAAAARPGTVTVSTGSKAACDIQYQDAPGGTGSTRPVPYPGTVIRTQSNGNYAYCVNPTKPGVNYNSSATYSTYPLSEALHITDPGCIATARLIMWFVYGSPGYTESMWNVGAAPGSLGSLSTADRNYALGHIMLTDVYMSNGQIACAGLSTAQADWVCWNVTGYNRVTGQTQNTGANGAVRWRMQAHASEVPNEQSFMVYAINDNNGSNQPYMSYTYIPTAPLSLTKTSSNAGCTNGNPNYSLAGAVYSVRDASGTQVATMTTDASGKAGPVELSPGTYTVVETKAPTGYKLDATPKTVTLSPGTPATVSFSDVPMADPIPVVLVKVDADGNRAEAQGDATLAGARFRVDFYAVDSSKVNGLSDLTGNPSASAVFQTDANGRLVFTRGTPIEGTWPYKDELGNNTIPLGAVKVTEVAPPTGYLMANPASYGFKISLNSAGTGTTLSTFDGWNATVNQLPSVPEEVIRGGVKVQKYDAETGATAPQGDATLAGCTVNIVNRSAAAVVVDGKSVAPGGVVGTLTTDANGSATSAADWLPYGTYEAVEKSAPEGYLPNTSWSQTFTVRSDGAISDLTSSSQRLPDQVIRGGVSLQKYDAEDGTNKPLGEGTLAGTVFNITNRSTSSVRVDGTLYAPGQVVGTITAGKDGVATSAADWLPYGTYEATEAQPPVGYLPNKEWSLTFSIREQGKVVDLSGNPDNALKNQVKRGNFSFVKVDGSSMERLPGVVFSVTSVKNEDGEITDGERHIIVTDENGAFDSDAWPHTQKTNANDDAVTFSDDGTYTVDESKLDPEAGTWFTGRTDLTVPANDSLGAMPYGTYRVQELTTSANDGYTPVAFTLVVRRDGLNVSMGTVDDSRVTLQTTAQSPFGKAVQAVEGATFEDVVAFDNVPTNTPLTLKATVHVAEVADDGTVTDAGALTDADGNPVASTVTFTTKYASGTKTVPMTIDASSLAGKRLVVFEELYQGESASGTPIATHEDIEDEGQTLTVPEIGTKATGAADNLVDASAETVTVTDTVSYKGLQPNRAYTVTGTLHLRDADGNDAGEVKDANGDVVTAHASFVPTSPSGEVDVTFTFAPPADLAGKTLVAFEELSYQGFSWATHADISDEDQTVIVPEIGTKASTDHGQDAPASAPQTITDTVSYKNLIAGKTYKMTATLHAVTVDADGKATDGGVVKDADGNAVTATAEFVAAEGGSGTVDVVFENVDLSAHAGGSVVVFEDCYAGDVKVGSHADITDTDQTVHVPAGSTQIRVGDGGQEMPSVGTATVTDAFTYSGLTPGKSYTVTGELRVAERSASASVADSAADALPASVGEVSPVTDAAKGAWSAADLVSGPVTVDLTASETGSGTVDVPFGEVNASKLSGSTLVALVRVSDGAGDVLVLDDAGDAAEQLTVPSIGTTLTGPDGSKEVAPDSKVTVTDTVTYENLVPGATYTLNAEGRLAVKADAPEVAPVAPDGDGSAADSPDDGTGSEDAPSEPSDNPADDKPAEGDGAVEAAPAGLDDHLFVTDDGGTDAADEPSKGDEGGADKADDTEVVSDDTDGSTEAGARQSADGSWYTDGGAIEGMVGTVTFTASETGSGTVEVPMELDTSKLSDGTRVVAYEHLVREDVPVAEHTDIADDGQTVTVAARPPVVVPALPQLGVGPILGLGAAAVAAGAAAVVWAVRRRD